LCRREITSSRLSFLQAQQPEPQPEQRHQLWALQLEQVPERGPEPEQVRVQVPERAPGRVFRRRRSNR